MCTDPINFILMIVCVMFVNGKDAFIYLSIIPVVMIYLYL